MITRHGAGEGKARAFELRAGPARQIDPERCSPGCDFDAIVHHAILSHVIYFVSMRTVQAKNKSETGIGAFPNGHPKQPNVAGLSIILSSFRDRAKGRGLHRLTSRSPPFAELRTVQVYAVCVTGSELAAPTENDRPADKVNEKPSVGEQALGRKLLAASCLYSCSDYAAPTIWRPGRYGLRQS